MPHKNSATQALPHKGFLLQSHPNIPSMPLVATAVVIAVHMVVVVVTVIDITNAKVKTLQAALAGHLGLQWQRQLFRLVVSPVFVGGVAPDLLKAWLEEEGYRRAGKKVTRVMLLGLPPAGAQVVAVVFCIVFRSLQWMLFPAPTPPLCLLLQHFIGLVVGNVGGNLLVVSNVQGGLVVNNVASGGLLEVKESGPRLVLR